MQRRDEKIRRRLPNFEEQTRSRELLSFQCPIVICFVINVTVQIDPIDLPGSALQGHDDGVPMVRVPLEIGICGQSYKASALINYNSRVVNISNLLVITSLES